MNKEFDLYKKWLDKIIEEEELDELSTIIIYNTYQLFSVYNIQYDFSDYNSNIFAHLPANCNDKTVNGFGIHFELFEMFKMLSNSQEKDFFQIKSLLKEQMLSYNCFALSMQLSAPAHEKRIISDIIKNLYTKCFNQQPSMVILSMLIASMLTAYKKHYNLLLGNVIMRLLLNLNVKKDECINSAYSFLKMQQNPHGYYGFYLQGDFKKSDLSTILYIGFDCMVTILEYENC